MNKILFKKIKDLELELLSPEVRKNKKRLNELLADDFIEFASAGFAIDKKYVLSNLPKENNVNWKVSDIKVSMLSNDLFLITYKVKKTDVKNKIIINSMRSSIWKDFNGKFKMVFHQGTLIKTDATKSFNKKK